jgi:uncharacterized protein YkwD
MINRGWLLRVALFVVAAFLPASSLLAPPAVAVTPAETTYASQAFKATNAKRVQHGLVRLKRYDCLHRFATAQARRMAAQRRIFHQDLGRILNACQLRMVGENVASGFRTGRAVVRGWMSSPDHRANILNRRYRHMAIAARKGSDGFWYVAQVLGRKG